MLGTRRHMEHHDRLHVIRHYRLEQPDGGANPVGVEDGRDSRSQDEQPERQAGRDFGAGHLGGEHGAGGAIRCQRHAADGRRDRQQ